MRVVITGGHLTPALAVIDELKEEAEIIFIGRKHATEGDKSKSAEAIVIPQLKIPFYPIEAGRLQRRFSRYTLISLLKIPVGFFQAFTIMIKNDPDVVVSFGGYVALPVVISAWIQRIPILTHEQTTETGLANKIIARFAHKIAVAWESSVPKFPKRKVVLTGNPIRQEVLQIKRDKLSKPVLYITGGNQGAHVINEAVEEIVPKLAQNWEVYHQTGSSEIYHDFERIEEKLKLLPEEVRKNYHLAKWYSTEELATILKKATLMVGRSGANTVYEMAYLGIPALFIPIPWSTHDEQTKNARIMTNSGAALILTQTEVTGKRLLSTLEIMISNLPTYQKAALEMKKVIKTDAAKKIAQETLKLAQSKK
jgi:UDP-N-acetylglucosamine--N-acetylmuramyl-(pentapeptide) pyrophosphoryl-undecaprenol N-acetylglucosamine transferase